MVSRFLEHSLKVIRKNFLACNGAASNYLQLNRNMFLRKTRGRKCLNPPEGVVREGPVETALVLHPTEQQGQEQENKNGTHQGAEPAPHAPAPLHRLLHFCFRFRPLVGERREVCLAGLGLGEPGRRDGGLLPHTVARQQQQVPSQNTVHFTHGQRKFKIVIIKFKIIKKAAPVPVAMWQRFHRALPTHPTPQAPRRQVVII
jgi:hypothetical protein